MSHYVLDHVILEFKICVCFIVNNKVVQTTVYVSRSQTSIFTVSDSTL